MERQLAVESRYKRHNSHRLGLPGPPALCCAAHSRAARRAVQSGPNEIGLRCCGREARPKDVADSATFNTQARPGQSAGGAGGRVGSLDLPQPPSTSLDLAADDEASPPASPPTTPPASPPASLPPSPPDSDDEPEPEPEPKPEPEPFWVDQQRVAAIRLEAEVAEGGRRAALLWRYALLLLRILRRWQVEGGDCMEAQESLLRGDEEESEEEGGEESHIVAGRDGMQRRAGLPRRGVGAQVMDTALEVGRHTHGGDGQIGNRQLTTGLKGVMADASDDTSVAFKFEKACATLHPLPHSQPQPHSLSLTGA